MSTHSGLLKATHCWFYSSSRADAVRTYPINSRGLSLLAVLALEKLNTLWETVMLNHFR
jgi:hypothetical protein